MPCPDNASENSEAAARRRATCGCDLSALPDFFMCDERMAEFCGECWPDIDCEGQHGEGCATSVYNA